MSSKAQNIGIMYTNALLFLPNIIRPKSIEKVFILYPDPHFKKSKQKGRIICRQTMAVFEYILRDDGLIYICTDVKTLFDYMCDIFDSSGLFKEFKSAECCISREDQKEAQEATKLLVDSDREEFIFKACYKNTDEAMRAGVKSGKVHARIYQKI